MNSKILIVEDEKELQNLVKLTLVSMGYDVITADDGAEGLEKIYQDIPDLVITDIKMIKMDGFQLCNLIRQNIMLNKLPIIVMTALISDADQLKGLSLGVDDYITKPFNINIFTAKVDNLLKRYLHVADINPITKLPGGIITARQINKYLKENIDFSYFFIKLKGYAEFCEYYGHNESEIIQRKVARIINDIIKQKGSFPEFISHISDDSFSIINRITGMDEIALKIINDFDKIAETFYNEEDRKRGYFILVNKQGEKIKCDFMKILISIAAVKNEQYLHFGEITKILHEISKKLSKDNISAYYLDKRISD